MFNQYFNSNTTTPENTEIGKQIDLNTLYFNTYKTFYKIKYFCPINQCTRSTYICSLIKIVFVNFLIQTGAFIFVFTVTKCK